MLCIKLGRSSLARRISSASSSAAANHNHNIRLARYPANIPRHHHEDSSVIASPCYDSVNNPTISENVSFNPQTQEAKSPSKCFSVHSKPSSRQWFNSFDATPKEVASDHWFIDSSSPVENTQVSEQGFSRSEGWVVDTASVKEQDPGPLSFINKLQMRVKGFVKRQFVNGKFCDILVKVIASPQVLEIAFQSLTLSLCSDETRGSNIVYAHDHYKVCFHTLSKSLIDGEFDLKSRIQNFDSASRTGANLLLPNVELKLVQEAIRMVLEAIYRPRFSKISHSCRNGRGQHSALKYIQKHIRDPDWWFTVSVKKKLDATVFMELKRVMRESIEDEMLFKFLDEMFSCNVLNVEFGGTPKGQGYVQEGILSAILINIYMDLLDQEIYKICLHYEALDGSNRVGKSDLFSQSQPVSKLRQWFLREANFKYESTNFEADFSKRIHACRYMDEIFVCISGPKEVAAKIRDRIKSFLEDSLHLKVDLSKAKLKCAASDSVNFLGMNVSTIPLSELHLSGKKIPLRVVSRLSDKLELFSQQKQRQWDALLVRLGKKWLAYSLVKIKESEKGKGGMVCDINKWRKPGMRFDHWFKEMLVIWIQDLGRQLETDDDKKSWLRKASEEEVLSKFIIESALPQDLRQSFYNFQDKVNDFLAAEAATLESMKKSLESTTNDTTGVDSHAELKIVIDAPLSSIKRSLFYFGILNRDGEPRCFHAILDQEDMLIIHWYSGVALRWIKCFSRCRNCSQINQIICEDLKNSCLRTLAKKHRASISQVVKHFGEKLSILRFPTRPDILPSQYSFLDDKISFGPTLWVLQVVKGSAAAFNKCSITCCNSKFTKLYSILKDRSFRILGSRANLSAAGFGNLHPNLERKYIALCKSHVKDLYIGKITFRDMNL